MVTFAQLRNMDLSRLTTAASQAGGLSSALSSRGSEVAAASNIPSGIWSGNDADAAGGLMSPLANPLWDAGDAFSSGRGILEDLADALEKAKTKLDGAYDAVAGTAAYITGNGDVVVPPGLEPDEHKRAMRAAKAARDIIDEALNSAISADDNASGALASSTAAFWPPGYSPPSNSPLSPDFWRGVGQAGKDRASEFWNGLNPSLSGPGVSVNDQGGWDYKLFNAEAGAKETLDPYYVKGGVSAGVGGSLGPMTSVGAEAGASVGVGVEGTAQGDGVAVNGNVGVEAGLKAGAGIDVGVEDGKFHAGGHFKAAAGAGFSGGASIDVDIEDMKNDWEDFANKTVKPSGNGTDPFAPAGPTT